MSCSLWRWTEACDGRPCCGECDLCGYEDEDEEEAETVTVQFTDISNEVEHGIS